MKINNLPTARIAINRNLLPAGTNVYLKPDQEFEIELFNPTQYNILAKIFINNEAISNSGIIIKPGKREWLERYIDKPRKFKFVVYDVESDNDDAKNTIKNNGIVRIEFYREKLKDNYYLLLDSNTPDLKNSTYDYSKLFKYINLSANINFNTNCLDLTNNVSNANIDEKIINVKLTKKTEETGRIECGSYSNQNLTIDIDFENDILILIEYKLLPLSKKPIDISKINVYCTTCGAKQKKSSWKFCPICGTKF